MSSSEVIFNPVQNSRSSVVLRLKAACARASFYAYTSYVAYRSGFPTPDSITAFQSHPNLRHRIFYPPDYQTGDEPPLFFDIHGGGFVLGDPYIDDDVNDQVRRELGCIVISCDYSKAPAAKFPTATNEIVDTILDVFADANITFDVHRVAIGGHSAGGNLAISVAQSPRFQSKIAAAVAWYPATDLSDDPAPKANLRPYDTAGEVDPLLEQLPMLREAYVAPGQDLRDPRLSIVFTNRAHLPNRVVIFGAEHDILCHEAWRMARRLTGQDAGADWDADPTRKESFDEDGVRWELIAGAKHGFTHFQGQTGAAEGKRMAQAQSCFNHFRDVMLKGPFSKAS